LCKGAAWLEVREWCSFSQMNSARSYRRKSAPREIQWKKEVPLFEKRELFLWVAVLVGLVMLPLGMIAALDAGEGGWGAALRSASAVAPFIIVVMILCVVFFLGLVLGVLGNRRMANYDVNADGISIVYTSLPVEGKGHWSEIIMNAMGGERRRKFIPWSRVISLKADVTEWKIRLETLDFGVVVLWASQSVYTDVMGAIEYWLHDETY
jgi:uncharacterized membrane protein YhaH (DUF805 family)